MTIDGPAPPDDDLDVFVAERPRLVGLAYRMLGTFADAEDVVQDAWLRWQAAERAALDRPAAWLTTVTTRLALDRLRTLRRRREDYVGPWLPEPIVEGAGPEATAELADSLTMGFLTVLDRLGPVERAVFLLADVFGTPFADVAAAVGKSEAACRQIASRARRRVQGADLRRPEHAERRVVEELLLALASGDVEAALARLAPGVVLVSDGGPDRHAARRPVVGPRRVGRFLTNLTRRGLREGAQVAPATVNGDPGIVVRMGDEVDIVIAFSVRDGLVSDIWSFRNPEKLEHVGEHITIA